jgi:hypothetical protein
MAVVSDRVTISTASGDGAAIIGQSAGMHGKLSVILAYDDGADENTVVTLTDQVGGVTRTLLVVTGKTSGQFNPHVPKHKAADGTAVADQYDPAELVGATVTAAVTNGGTVENAVAVTLIAS